MPQDINKTRVALGSRRARLIVFLIFLSLTALFGGGSRADIQSLILLRPLAALACGYAFVTLSPAQLGAVRVPLAFLLAFGLLHLLQLVPLPPDLWQGLPKRDAIVEIERTLGLSDVWRPLTAEHIDRDSPTSCEYNRCAPALRRRRVNASSIP